MTDRKEINVESFAGNTEANNCIPSAGDIDQPAESKPVLAQGRDKSTSATPQKEINGPKGLEPTRYGDWESKGRCYDF